jgi:hypothetical protein
MAICGDCARPANGQADHGQNRRRPEGPDRAKAVAHQIAEKPHQRHGSGEGAEG